MHRRERLRGGAGPVAARGEAPALATLNVPVLGHPVFIHACTREAFLRRAQTRQPTERAPTKDSARSNEAEGARERMPPLAAHSLHNPYTICPHYP